MEGLPRRRLLLGLLASFFLWVFSCEDDPLPPQNHEHHDELCGHVEARGLVLETQGTLRANTWDGAVQGQLETRVSALLHDIEVIFLSPDSTHFVIPDSCVDNFLIVSVADTTVASASQDPGVQTAFHLFGKQVGTTNLTVEAWHGPHEILSAGPIPVSVTSLQKPAAP